MFLARGGDSREGQKLKGKRPTGRSLYPPMPAPITPDTAPLPPGVRLLPLNDAPPEARAILFPYHMGRQWRACLGMLGFAAASGWMAAGGGSSGSLPLGLNPRLVGGFGVLFFVSLAVWTFRNNLRPRFLAAASDGVVLSRTGGGDLLPWDAINVATVEKVPGPGGEQTVLAFRFRPEDRDRFLPRLRKEMEWNREVCGPDLVLPVPLFAAPPDLILATLDHYLRHPEERERLGPSGLPRVLVYRPGQPEGAPGDWAEAGRDPSPFAHGPRLERFRQQLLRGEAELTPERLREVLADLDPDPLFSPPELCFFEACAAPWMEAARPEWLLLTRDLLLHPDLDPHLRDQDWLFGAELGERFPEELVRTFAPLLTRPASEAGQQGRLLALEFLGGSGREEAAEYLAPLVREPALPEAELEALAVALATLRTPRSVALLAELREHPAWSARPRPELEEQLRTLSR